MWSVGGGRLAEELLALTAADPFARGALALALGQHGGTAALPLLRQIAAANDAPPYVRFQALAGLMWSGGLLAETTALFIVGDAAAPPDVRAAAAAALPETLSSSGCATLRELLERERLPDGLCAALLTALGRARDRAALPVIMRFCRRDRPAVVRAAVAALAAIGDPVVVPVLVGLSQQADTERGLRLHAAGALLLLGGEPFLPLLRSSLERGTLALQLQALGYIQQAQPYSGLLLELLDDASMLLTVRQQVVAGLPVGMIAGNTLCALLSRADQPLALRLTAARRLAGEAWPASLGAALAESFGAAAGHPECPLSLCNRAIAALAAMGSPAASAALGRLADTPDLPHEARVWAIDALVESGRLTVGD
jgi:HEAT repeat protein